MIPKIKIYKDQFGNPKFSYVSIIVLTGSVFENKKEKGISHFIEHLVFKGSEFNDNIKILNNKLNSKGMNVNAFTTNFITAFYIETPTEYIKYAIEALIQIVFNPLFRKEDIENERKVVINELVEKMHSPEILASMKAQQIIYPKENPLHNPVIGSIESLKKIGRCEIVNYYDKYYRPENIIFFTSTSKNKNTVKKIWENTYKEFGNINKKYQDYESTLEIFEKMKPKLKLTGKPGLYRLTKYFPRNSSYYVLANFILPKLKEKELFALEIFANYLAGSLSSILFIEMREKKQLIYSVNSTVGPRVDITNFLIEFNCKKNSKILRECIETIDKTLRDFYKNGINSKEFNKFKNKTLINYERVKEMGKYKINRFVSKIFYGISENNYESILKSISINYFNKTVKKIFNNKSKKEFVFIV